MKRILLLIFLISYTLFAQENTVHFKIPDSIQSKTYFELYELFFENYRENPKNAHIYANAYLEKGKSESKNVLTAHGYFLISHLYMRDERCLGYADSIIRLTKASRNNGLLTRGYLLKGDYFLKKGLFQKACSNYKMASQVVVESSNSRTKYFYNRSIALLKSSIGQHREALNIFRECYQYAFQEDIEGKFEDMFFLAKGFNKLKMLDSASYYNREGIRESLNAKNKKELYNLFALNSGVTHFHKTEYKKAIDSITKVLSDLKENTKNQELITSYLYLGKVYFKIDLKEKGVHYLKKMDSVTQLQEVVFSEMSEGYELLINHFEKQKNTEKKLLYTQKLSKIKMILNRNKTDSLQQVIKEYNVPLIVSKKDKKISYQDSDITTWKGFVIISVLLIVISIGIMIYLYNDRNRYQKSFRAVVSYTNKVSGNHEYLKKTEKEQLDDLKISPESVQKILNGIKDFEDKKRYLNKKYTLNVLAKELKTNSTYLSKIINIYKEKNFSNYLHDLRVGYAIERLRDDEKFRRYSIKGISEEVGFKTSESFAKAFHKKTGIYPSSFIKRLKST
ncbi:helix-turn-helix domain-containing protein [Aquimarina algiphila]|uniref:helix-turn-helix domain-containing protein n=1 Tax=Aquimarina algiphila TaxID=2047982 RepID=UPI0023307327|nr:helix-turn-helix domain-containing protein [Aquimarina algiphila]